MKSPNYILCKPSRVMLSAGLIAVLALVFYIALLLEGASSSESGLLFFTLRCRLMLDYALISLVLLVGGALFTDCVYKGKIK